MSFEQFQHALEECAAARGDDVHCLEHAVTQCKPIAHGTVAGRIKWCAYGPDMDLTYVDSLKVSIETMTEVCIYAFSDRHDHLDTTALKFGIDK